MSRTTVIGLDGLTYRILDPLMDAGVMPFTRAFIAGGVRAELMSTDNPMTMQAWPAIMTGYGPGRHGVLDFVRSEERDGEFYVTLYDSRDLRCDTIWAMASRAGLRSVSLNFPVMYPPPEIDAYIVPGMTSWRHLKLGIRPPSLYEELKAMEGLDYKELAWDFEQGKKVVHGIPPEEYESWVKFHIRREGHWFSIVRHLMQTDPCPLTAVLFDGPDKLFHICWRFLDPAYLPQQPTAWETHIRELCLEYFRRMDTYIEQIVAMSGPDSTVILASDHGFAPKTDTFNVNVWLEEQGLLAWRSAESLDDQGTGAWKRRLKTNIALLDWHRTKAYASTSSSNALYIRMLKTPGDGGVPARDYYAFRAMLIERLSDIRHPATGRPFVTRVWTKEEAFGNDLPNAPDLLLRLHDHGFVSIKNCPQAILFNEEVTGTHHPAGIFVAQSPGMTANLRCDPLSILDVAPTILYNLGIEIPEDFPGRVPSEVYDRAWLDRHPVRIGRAGARQKSLSATASGARSDALEDEQLIRRLEDLGYL